MRETRWNSRQVYLVHESRVELLRSWITSGPEEDGASNNMVIVRDTDSGQDTQEELPSFVRAVRTASTRDCRPRKVLWCFSTDPASSSLRMIALALLLVARLLDARRRGQDGQRSPGSHHHGMTLAQQQQGRQRRQRQRQVRTPSPFSSGT